jgi:hypothetical protein
MQYLKLKYIKYLFVLLLVPIFSLQIVVNAQSREKNEGIVGTLTKVPIDKSGVNVALREAIIAQYQKEGENIAPYEFEKFSLLEADLNGDGRKESIVMFMNGRNCSNRYCPNYIFTHNKNKTKYQPIGEFGSSRGVNLLMSTHRTNGWRDLITSTFNYQPRGSTLVLIKFDGKKYDVVRSDLQIPPNIQVFPKPSEEAPLLKLDNRSNSEKEIN